MPDSGQIIPQNNNAQRCDMCEIGLAQSAGMVFLIETDFSGRAFKGPPLFYLSLKSSKLAVAKFSRMCPLKPFKQRLGFETGIGFQFFISRTAPQISSNGSSRVLQVLSFPHWLGNFPSSMYFRAVFSHIPALALATAKVSLWFSFISLLTCRSVTTPCPPLNF